MKTIPLTQGKVALVDDQDYVSLSQIKWCAHKDPARAEPHQFTAVSNTTINGKNVCRLMHRIILNAQRGDVVDHVDGNPLNNLRSNLRLASASQNGANQGLRKNNSSGYKGVHFDRRCNKFAAQISINGKRKNLGRFLTATEAAQNYNDAALKAFGSFAKLNDVSE